MVGAQPARRHERPTNAEFRAFMLDMVDLDVLARLPDVIEGDPNVMDGAVEWIEVVQDDFRKRISFPAGRPPHDLVLLADFLRARREFFEAIGG